MSSQLTNLVPIMNSLNYLPWKEQSTAFVKSQGVWTIVTGDEAKPVMPTMTMATLTLEIEKEKCTWTNCNHQAEGYILLCLSLQVLQTVSGKNTTK